MTLGGFALIVCCQSRVAQLELSVYIRMCILGRHDGDQGITGQRRRMVRKWITALGFVALIAFVLPGPSLQATKLDGDDLNVRFDGGIGVDPVGGIVVSGTPPAPVSPFVKLNTVRGVSPAGALWTIRSLKAEWKNNGHISVEGRGLVLAGGNSIGSPDSVTSVVAAFFCGSGSTTPLETIPAIPLNAAGDFKFNADGFSAPPVPCVAPVLLILNASGSSWFAAGIPVVDLDD